MRQAGQLLQSGRAAPRPVQHPLCSWKCAHLFLRPIRCQSINPPWSGGAEVRQAGQLLQPGQQAAQRPTRHQMSGAQYRNSFLNPTASISTHPGAAGAKVRQSGQLLQSGQQAAQRPMRHQVPVVQRQIRQRPEAGHRQQLPQLQPVLRLGPLRSSAQGWSAGPRPSAQSTAAEMAAQMCSRCQEQVQQEPAD